MGKQQKLVAAVQSTARNNFLIAALWSETSLVFPALQMLRKAMRVLCRRGRFGRHEQGCARRGDSPH